MKKLGIVITDGVGFRNFIMSEFILEATNQFDAITIYSGLPISAFHSISKNNIDIKELDVFVEGKATWFFRKWKEVAHLQKHQSFYGMKDNLIVGYPKNNSARALLVKLIYFCTRFVHSDVSILLAEKLQFLSFSKNKIAQSYFRILEEDKPSHVFFTHQRPPFLAPFLYAAQQLKITTSTFIFSWDNLASKGRMLGAFDCFLVWSHLMKAELVHFYPMVKSEKVKVVGTPQFEPYVMSKYKTTAEAFYTKFQLDSRLKTICYSCADVSIGSNDPIAIRAIADGIRNNSITTKVQLLVRTSPAEGDSRFHTIRAEYPEIKWNVPKWVLTRGNHAESWSQRVSSEEDIKDLRSLLEYVDLNVNMCSTMSLDFMLFDKPVINTVFGNPENGLYNDQRFLNYDHYKKVVDSQSVTIAKNETELIDQINQALSHPKERTLQRKTMIDLQISEPLEGTSKRISKTLFYLND
ncbi:CDP-glycerol glycerophosphotransferase family protein [Flavobacterium soyangense]|uniref:CDP-glycerol glycerophosphotransferase family protein n=1 Tax=Flavobacterium soyangense TaxID=2023265 RepID=A0A930Y092_9FLAO|nr:CDP-glycerol glycerophosphotransferase family protein [Flavobacterium soyangense]MBF2708244.1 CDP-glycerol glycerophosphotransferase family protein [Flavobacterium soyangense]